MIIGYFKGDIYNKGDGVHGFLSRYFTSTNIKKYEIWTGTYNKNRQQSRLFCNRDRKSSILDVSLIDHELTQTMEPIFADGNITLIGEAGIASASIPSLVPAQNIMGEDYIDGGVACASPLLVMQEPILKYTKDHDCPLHIIYVNSIDLSSTNVKPIRNASDNWTQIAHDVVRSQIVNDRLAAYQLLRCHPGILNKEKFICNYQNIQRVKAIQSRIK
jgi:predicted acylesterase/phospholipase RssA